METPIVDEVCFLCAAATAISHPSSGIVVNERGKAFFVHTGRGLAKLDRTGELTTSVHARAGTVCASIQIEFLAHTPEAFRTRHAGRRLTVIRWLSNQWTHGCLIGQGRRVSYQPLFTVTPALLARAEQIAALRERILAATVEVRGFPRCKKTRAAQHAFLDGHRE